jgi:hypothetical protein
MFETPSFNVRLVHEAGAAWFAALNAKRTSVLLHYSNAYLWDLPRTPLMVLSSGYARMSFSTPALGWWLQWGANDATQLVRRRQASVGHLHGVLFVRPEENSSKFVFVRELDNHLGVLRKFRDFAFPQS